MKILLLTLLLSSALCKAEEFPLREPKGGEERPSWWATCWSSHIVVIEGKLTFEDDGKPDVEVKMSEESAKKELDEEGRDLQQSLSKFYIGRIVPKKILFTSPGITSEGPSYFYRDEVKVLIPLREWDGTLEADVKNGQDAVYVFQYGSQMIYFPLVLREKIPREQLIEANRIFDHRVKYDHRNQKAEQDGASQPAGPSESKLEGKENRNPGAEERPR